MERPEVNSTWTHKREGYSVQVTEPGTLQIKDADAANWNEGVVYIRLDEAEGGVPDPYARSVEDFLDKFEPEAEFDAGDEE